MNFVYSTAEHGKLTITANAEEREWLKGLRNESGEFARNAEYEALEHLICNSELEWMRPEEIGALTDAPILCIRGAEREVPPGVDTRDLHVTGSDGTRVFYEPVEAAWGYMDYALRSFIEDLIGTGKAVFIS